MARRELFSETLIPTRELSLILGNAWGKSPRSKEQPCCRLSPSPRNCPKVVLVDCFLSFFSDK